MRQANLRLNGDLLKEWEVFKEAGILEIEILSCEGNSGVTRVTVENPVDEDRLDEIETIEWWDRVATEGSDHVYLFASDVSDSIATSDGLPRAEAVTVTDDGPTITCVGSQAQISDLVAQAQANDLDVTLERLHDYRTGETALETLTHRQREVLDVAFERGYYDVPRRVTTEELASELDIDDSTVSEHLQRAERNLVKALLD